MSNSSKARVRDFLLPALSIPGTCHAAGNVSTGTVWFFALLFVGAVIFPSRNSFIASLLHALFKLLIGMLGMLAEAEPDKEEPPKEKPSTASIKQSIFRRKLLVLLVLFVTVVGLRWISAFLYTNFSGG